MKLDEALESLDAITAAANRSNTFDGLRAFPTGLTSLVACVASYLQYTLNNSSADSIRPFLVIWVSVASIVLSIVIADMVLRYYRDPTARARRMTLDVLARLSPAIVVGGALTAIIYFTAKEVAWLLPGMWATLLGLGIFAASPLLPRSLQTAGIWYIGCGLAVLMLGQNEWQLHALTMAVPFVGGQALAAYLMHREQHPSDSHQQEESF